MRRPTPFIAVPALLVACALALSACGGEDAQLLPGETAREIDANLTTVQRLAAEGDCAGAEGAVAEVGEQIEGLQGVDPKLKRALEKGAARLDEVISQCEETEVETTVPEATEGEEGEVEEDEEESKPKKQRKEKEPAPREAGGESGGKKDGGGSKPAPERSEKGEERSQGREGPEGGGAGGGGEVEEEAGSGGVGPGTEAGGGE